MNMVMDNVVDASAEFDQVREHDHREGAECWCGINSVVEQVADDLTRENFARPVPAVCTSVRRPANDLEERIAPMGREALKGVIRELDSQNAMLRSRVDGFESLLATISNEADRLSMLLADAEKSTPLKAA